MPLFANISAWINGQVSGPAKRLVYLRAPEENGLGRAAIPIRAQQDYFRIVLAEMQLSIGTQWFTERYPAVYALTTLSFGGQETDIANVAGPTRLQGINPADLGRSIVQNSHLTPLLPFSGGTVRLEAGLVSLQAHNALVAFIDTLGAFAGRLNIPALSTALDLAGPLVNGLQGLLGVSGAQLVVRLAETYAGTTLLPGYIAAFGDKGRELDPKRVLVRDGKLHCDAVDGRGLLDGQDYMLFRVERVEERDDWDQLRPIAEPFRRAVEALTEPGEEGIARGRALLRAAVVTALASADLTQSDRIRVAKALKQRFDEMIAQGAVDSGPIGLAGAMTRLGGSGRPTAIDLQKTPEQIEHEIFVSN
jgi:hypothetical protein